MHIIGINSSGYTTSASLVSNGNLIFGCAEERLSRVKHSKYFPVRSIKACLDYASLTIEDIDYFAIGYNPGTYIASRTRAGFSEWPAYPGARLFSNPNYLLPMFHSHSFDETIQSFVSEGKKDISIRYVQHHIAHMSNAFFLSNFQEAAIFSYDGYGERATTVFGIGNREKGIDIIKEINFPHSIGSLYATMTQYLGFSPDGDEWKVMGAAAYGDYRKYIDSMRSLIKWDNEANYELDLSYFNNHTFDVSPLYTEKMTKIFCAPRRKDQPMTKEHFDLAAALQKVIEEYVLSALNWLYKFTNIQSLCISGGCALNSLCNGKITTDLPFKKVFIPYAPDDSGNSIGAALWVAHKENELLDSQINNSPFLGYEYSDSILEECLKQYKLDYFKVEDPYKFAAHCIADGKVLGWFQDRMEFGPRALGARSILADPRSAEMKDIINNAVKYRESYRPFAPAILEDSLSKWFYVNAQEKVPYMEKVLKFREGKGELVKAVCHEDGTGRVQTVNEKENSSFYRLISEFYKKTNVPIILNTSFNLNGEPIVASPQDAIRTFYSSGLDILILGSFVIKKVT